MSSRDKRTNMAAVKAFSTALINSSTTTAGSKLDLAGFESCTFVMFCGVVTAGAVTPLVEDSADNTTFAPVSDTFLVGTEAAAAAVLLATGAVATIGYIGHKRYVRLSYVSDGTTNLTTGAVAIKECAHNSPAAVS